MTLPIETVLDLLMNHANRYLRISNEMEYPLWLDLTAELRVEAKSLEDLRTKVRTCLETLVEKSNAAG